MILQAQSTLMETQETNSNSIFRRHAGNIPGVVICHKQKMGKNSMKIRNMWKRFCSENGAVTMVEGTYVFPIVFLVLGFLIFFGYLFFMKASIQSVVSQEAIRGAQYYSNPWTEEVNEEGKTFSDSNDDLRQMDVKPYRNIVGVFADRTNYVSRVRTDAENRLRACGLKIGESGRNVSRSTGSCEVNYKNYLVYSYVEVKADYTLVMPIRFFGENQPMRLQMSAYDMATVSDNSEFVRNVDMAMDYVQRTKVYADAKEKMGKVYDKISEFWSKLNG